jgi:hypothetical protein
MQAFCLRREAAPMAGQGDTSKYFLGKVSWAGSRPASVIAQVALSSPANNAYVTRGTHVPPTRR